jgi:hypothetical protein
MKIKRKTLKKMGALLLFIVIVGGVFGGIYVYTATSLFTIYNYSIEGGSEDDVAFLQESFARIAEGKTFGMFPSNKVLSINTRAIERTVREHIPSTRLVTIKAVGLHSVHVIIQEYTPVVHISSNTGITHDGIIFTTKRNMDMYPLLSMSSSSTKKGEEYGHAITISVSPKPEDISAIASFAQKITTVLFPVKEIVIDDVGDISFIDTTTMGKIILAHDGAHEKTWSTLISAIDTEPLKSKLATQKEKLRYIDVRFGNKAFYSFGERLFQNSTSTGILDDHEGATTTPATTTQ